MTLRIAMAVCASVRPREGELARHRPPHANHDDARKPSVVSPRVRECPPRHRYGAIMGQCLAGCRTSTPGRRALQFFDLRRRVMATAARACLRDIGIRCGKATMVKGAPQLRSGHGIPVAKGRILDEGNEDPEHPVLPARLTPTEQEFFVELRRLVDTSGLSARKLAGMTHCGTPDPEGPVNRPRAPSTRSRNGRTVNGQSLRPRVAGPHAHRSAGHRRHGRREPGRVVGAGIHAHPYPQETGDAVPQPRAPGRRRTTPPRMPCLRANRTAAGRGGTRTTPRAAPLLQFLQA